MRRIIVGIVTLSIVAYAIGALAECQPIVLYRGTPLQENVPNIPIEAAASPSCGRDVQGEIANACHVRAASYGDAISANGHQLCMVVCDGTSWKAAICQEEGY